MRANAPVEGIREGRAPFAPAREVSLARYGNAPISRRSPLAPACEVSPADKSANLPTFLSPLAPACGLRPPRQGRQICRPSLAPAPACGLRPPNHARHRGARPLALAPACGLRRRQIKVQICVFGTACARVRGEASEMVGKSDVFTRRLRPRARLQLNCRISRLLKSPVASAGLPSGGQALFQQLQFRSFRISSRERASISAEPDNVVPARGRGFR